MVAEKARAGAGAAQCWRGVALLLCIKVMGRWSVEALVCGAHLQTHCVAKRIMFVCEDMIDNPAVNLLKLIWEVHACDHLQASSHMQKMSHKRLRKV